MTTTNSKRRWLPAAVALIAAGPAGGFLFGITHAGDPDPNPIGRIVYACMMAVQTPLHAGFPPHWEAGAGGTVNAWPHIAISGLFIFVWFTYQERKAARKQVVAAAGKG